ncbi:hypothetical protein ASPACDRAFT_79365 [Aspergillus aculeatus ATCC 16872]|uniref:N-acetyltransferase domain-containing protein n=1 Tax=Aspergillus aculeatus (strain ATCC 16872 / CBS 172.66 / WB 5094) TaxID=690307 RepID=A0A1L9WU96_ASPA1|nr:uncharacterized protein ASPACDRAFT_79365 [Aspergillus aculeatus ATCC 16872]OJJ99467.1 hypothetical protein ASPACDRAFT_79365 [Aspergillus aculeatus ATCC 16872]
MPPLSQYHFEILPHDEASVQQWAPKYIEFRLNALKTAPDSFGSSYEKEASMSEAEWKSMLCEPAFRVIIAVPRADDGALQAPVWENEWALISSLYGPRCHHEPYHDNENDCNESSWFLGTSFVSPHHRQRGMILEAFATAERAAVSEDRQTFQKRHHAQQLQRPSSGHRSHRFRTRMLGLSATTHPTVLNYYRETGLEVSHTIRRGDVARLWRWKIMVGPDKAEGLATILVKIIPWDGEGNLARL